MLPSTGLFKSIICPFFYSETHSCLRPYCHFRHVRKDDSNAGQSKPPEYTASSKQPMLLTLAEPAVKKKKLEYTPIDPGINVKKKSPSALPESTAPVYVPSESLQTTAANIANIDLNDCDEELEELSGIIGEQLNQNDSPKTIAVKIKEEPPFEIVKVKEEPPEVPIKKEPEEIIAPLDVTEIKIEKVTVKKEPEDKDNSKSSSATRSHSENGKSSSSHRKHKKSSRERVSEKSRSNSSSERRSSKEKSTENERKEHSKKSSASSSSDRRHSQSQHKHKSSSSDKDRSKTTSNSDKNTHKHTSSSSSSTKSREKPVDHNSSSKKSSPPPAKTIADIDVPFDNMEDLFPNSEEDIRRECEMIYDQVEQEFASMHKATPVSPEATKRKISTDEVEEEKYPGKLSKKRVAHENCVNTKPSTPIQPKKPSFMQNAVRAVYERQEAVRKKQEEEAAAAAAALKEAEEKVREANEALRKVQEKGLTPLIPKSYLQPPKPVRSIAPVANMLALERAKKKVEELKAERMRAFTPSQTAPKTTGRVAHCSTNAPKVTPPKPPVLEPTSTKISFNLRMQYYELMVKHCSAIYPNEVDAWERAQTEELTVFKKCNTPVIYKNSAMLTINKLRKESVEAGNKAPNNNKLQSHEVVLAGKLANSTSWSVAKKMRKESSLSGNPFDKLPGDKAYDLVYELRMTEEQLISNGYPRPGARPGTAVITNPRKNHRCTNENERYCRRCSKLYNLSMYDTVAVDQCNYHPKSTGYRRGFADHLHRCCQQPAGTPGCSYANYHVTEQLNAENLKGYVTTIDKGDGYVSTKKDIYALDCEMCYTTQGIELTRVTVVDINSRTVYDALVKPDNKIVDYNTIFSGITEQMLEHETRTLRDVQGILLSMFHSKTVLVGHSLESDLKALKIIHDVVVDTSILYPHKMGPPQKRALKTLCNENLKRIIQENEAGHDSAEDAEVCIQLVKFYLKNRIS